MTYRTETPEAEVIRLRREVEELQKGRQETLLKFRALQNKSRQKLWGIVLIFLGAIPPALVIRFHAPGRVMLLDVLGFALWGWFTLRVNRRG